MPETRKHIFLVPLKAINKDFLDDIRLLDHHASARFSFLLSIQDRNSYQEVIESEQFSESVIVIRPERYYNRTQHWEYIVKYAHENLTFDSFSYYFFGDTIKLDLFPDLNDTSEIYINDYYIDKWDELRENVTREKISKFPPQKIICHNLIMGRPLLAPLQKFIFDRKVANQIIFDHHKGYVCDQLMVNSLICAGNQIEFIKSPFYKINNKNRSYSASLSIFDMIKQQIYLYVKMRCIIGIPMVILRTLLKSFIKLIN